MSPRSRLLECVPLALTALLLLLAAPPARAGCGCDHPAPDWSVVMPPFGSPGKVITLFANGGGFTPGQVYEVDFGWADVYVQAEMTDRIQVAVPPAPTVGPAEIRVTGYGYDHTYPKTAFTVLGDPHWIPEQSGVFTAPNAKLAVGEDGTLYLPLDVSAVRDPYQFAFALINTPLLFGHDDVVIYNSDGFDLTLFTLDVTDPTARQWGSYHGWSVEDDSGFHRNFFRGKAYAPGNLQVSSIFTYWRHEFHAYVAAHGVGGSHEVDANGLHPDGTLHIDHFNIVIAISGVLRDSSHPTDPTRGTPLSPGSRDVTVAWLALRSDNPVEPTAVGDPASAVGSSGANPLFRVPFREHRGSDDDD